MILEELTTDVKLPRIAILDDRPTEVQSIETGLKEKGIPFEFREIDLTEGFQGVPIGSVELVFLDLNYEGAQFSPFLCLEAIKTVVNVGQRYFLVAWTKDPDLLEQVIVELRDEGLMPVGYTSIQKARYRTADEKYDVDALFKKVEAEFKNLETEEVYLGQVLKTEENSILINCLIGEGEFEVRRFDNKPFGSYISVNDSAFIKIKVTTKPGSRVFEFSNEIEDHSKLFIKTDDFKELGDVSFLKEGDDDDNV